jgi:hypothetical protein
MTFLDYAANLWRHIIIPLAVQSPALFVIRSPGILGQTHECYVAFELEAKHVNSVFALKQPGTKRNEAPRTRD